MSEGTPAGSGRGAAEISRALFEAYGDGNMETMRSLFASEAVSFITNGEGGVDRVEGRDGFMARLPDLSGAEISTAITQVVEIDPERAMTMVEVKAARGGRTLHNFAAFLTRLSEGRVVELWMVDAKPAESDDFWS
jgi:ketosteroid isomerase-like protein